MSTRRRLIGLVAALLIVAATATRTSAAVDFTVDPSATWNGFMNVFELPSNGGGFVFNSGWGTADLTATFAADVLTLGPNSVNDTSTFWYQGGGAPGNPGNKNMDANMYVQREDISGTTVNFSGKVLSNTLISPYTSVAFIKDFAPDFSSNVTVTVPLTPGDFNVTLNTLPGAGRHVQYGFETIGPNVWITDRGPVGTVQITSIPEPASAMLLGLGVCATAALRRRRA